MRLGTAPLRKNQIVLVVSGLRKRRPNALRPIFRELNFSVLAGQIVVLIGESGGW